MMNRLAVLVVALSSLGNCQYNPWQSQPAWQLQQQQRPVRQYWPQAQQPAPSQPYYPQEQQANYWPQEPQQQPQYVYQQPQQPQGYDSIWQQQPPPPQQQTQTSYYNGDSGGLQFASRFPQAAQQYKAFAKLSGATVNGNVTFTQDGDGPVRLQGQIVGLPDGKVGFHVHEKGDLSGGCMTLGAHFNPTMATHGAPEDSERHVGDLGNIESRYGTAHIDITDSLISLHGPHSIIGRGLVVHSGVDDLGRTRHPDSKKTGNAGGRAACGVIGIIDAPNSSSLPVVSVALLIGSLVINMF